MPEGHNSNYTHREEKYNNEQKKINQVAWLLHKS